MGALSLREDKAKATLGKPSELAPTRDRKLIKWSCGALQSRLDTFNSTFNVV